MNRTFLTALMAAGLILQAEAAQTTYLVPPGTTISNTNNGVVTTPPVIDAVNFINYGTFNISTLIGTPLPFETFDTLNFTNYVTMIGMNGWRFDFASNVTGRRSMAASFVNLNPGVIEATDPPTQAYYTAGLCAVAAVDPSYLLIWATNIIVGGGTPGFGASLVVGADGKMELVGRDVDLAHAGLMVTPVSAESVGNVTSGNTNYIPDIAIYDTYWAQTNFNNNTPLAVRNIWDGNTARAQGVPAQPQAAPAFALASPYSDWYSVEDGQFIVNVTNYTGDATNVLPGDIVVTPVILYSNVVKGAVFGGVPQGFGVSSAFVGGAQPNNLANEIDITIGTTIPNPVTGLNDAVGLVLEDVLGSDTRVRGTAVNSLFCSGGGSRPANYILLRGFGDLGGPLNGTPPADFFTTSGFVDPNILRDAVTNFSVAAGDYAAYGAEIDSVVSRPPLLPTASVSNVPGQINIVADRLDLTATRIRGEGRVRIETPHLISSSNAVVDCENLSFNLGSITGNLKVQNLAPEFTSGRLKGNVSAWSANWSNTVTIVLANYGFTTNEVITPDPVDTNLFTTNLFLVATNAFITNNISARYHFLMFDARQLTTLSPVAVYDFFAHSRDIQVDDSMSLVENLLFDGQSLTLNGNITIPGTYPANPIGLVQPLQNFIGTNAPNLLFFTNNGTFIIVGEGHFGDDRPPYSTFINRGAVEVSGLSLRTRYLENPGSLVAANAVFIRCDVGRLQGGSIIAGNNFDLRAADLKFDHYTLDAGVGPISFSVTNVLSDTGPGSGNTFRIQDGFSMRVKPQGGDLLGTTIQETAPGANRIFHVWAGEDRGASSAGFTDNVAIGRLVLTTSDARAKLVFSGTGAHNGLYVDVLDLTSIASSQDLLSELQIDPNMVIYFAAATLGFTPPANANGVPQEPEEYLDGLFGGHLRWVRTYAGPNSSQVILINGQSVAVNRALLNSRIIDSDNDTVPNYFDAGLNGQVFETAPLALSANGNGTVVGGGAALIVGETYTVSAVPAPGATFTGWTGSIESQDRVLTFVMEPGMELVANFSFAPTVGTYNGLFYQSGGVEFMASGSFSANVTAGGKYSAKIQMGNKRFSIAGQLDPGGADARGIPKSGMFMELQATPDQIVGTISQEGEWTANLVADRAVFDGKNNKAPFAGNYTMVLPGTNDPALPGGDSYGNVTVDNAGRVKFSGSLADGTKVTQTSVAAASGQWPLYVPLYGGQGQLIGWMTFAGSNGDLGGLLSWIKEPSFKARFYPEGFQYETSTIGSKYSATHAPVTDFTAGTAVLSGGNLNSSSISNRISVATNNVVTVEGTNKMTLSITTSQGLFKGSAINPATGKAIKFSGALLQNARTGSGYFLGSDQSGKVEISF